MVNRDQNALEITSLVGLDKTLAKLFQPSLFDDLNSLTKICQNTSVGILQKSRNPTNLQRDTESGRRRKHKIFSINLSTRRPIFGKHLLSRKQKDA